MSWPPEGFKRATQEEFSSFIASYPRQLAHRTVTIGDPPSHGFFDETLGEGYAGRVAFWQGWGFEAAETEYYVSENRSNVVSSD